MNIIWFLEKIRFSSSETSAYDCARPKTVDLLCPLRGIGHCRNHRKESDRFRAGSSASRLRCYGTRNQISSAQVSEPEPQDVAKARVTSAGSSLVQGLAHLRESITNDNVFSAHDIVTTLSYGH